MQVGCEYANYEEGVVKIFHIFFAENICFPQPFFQLWACLKMRFFHRKNDIFCGCKQRRRNEQRNQQKNENMRAIQVIKERSRAVEKKGSLHGLKLMNANVHRTKWTWQRHTAC